MKKSISLFIALIFLFNTTLAYTLKVTVKGIDLIVTREAGNEIELEAKVEDIIGWEVKKGDITITDNVFVMPEEDVEIEAIIAEELGTYSLVVETPFLTRREDKIEEQSVTVEATSTEEYIFANWTATGITLTEEQKTSETITFIMPANDVTLIANYQEVLQEYTITYDANGGSGAPSAQVQTEGETLTLSSEEPIREGYDFLGWATSSTATNTQYAPEEEFVIYSDITLYAVWNVATMSNTLASGTAWYTLGETNIEKSSITSIDIKDSYTSQSYVKMWDASSKRDNSVLAYIEDDGSGNSTYKLTLAGNGTGKIYANTNSCQAFRGFLNATSINGFKDENNNVIFDTSNVTNMRAMFYECSSLTALDVSGFDTSNVESMQTMFYKCSSLTALDVSGFDTVNVTGMLSMFYDCKALDELDVSGFNTSKVTNMSHMFCGCSGLTTLAVSEFDTSNVTNMTSMFYGCTGLTSLDVSGFNTSNVTTMYAMFCNCSSLTTLAVSNFDTSNVESMRAMFYGCSGLTNLDVSGFDTSNVESMQTMFYKCSGLAALDVSGFDTTNVTDMLSMFYGCSSVTSLSVNNFNINNVIDLRYMFCECSSLANLDVSSFNTNNVIDMTSMFYKCSGLVNITLGENFGQATNVPQNNLFYVTSNVNTIVTGANSIMSTYDWAADNRTVSFEN